MLDTIKEAEGGEYNKLYGGTTFSDFCKHPPGKIGSDHKLHSPAGAFQMTLGTWDGIAKELGLNDFGPFNQRLAAARDIATHPGAVSSLDHGNIAGAVGRLNKEWSSLPGGATPKYDLPTFISRYDSHLATQ